MSTTTENKDLIRRFTKAFNERDLEGAASLMADDVVNHAAIPEAQGAKGWRRVADLVLTAVPDQRFTCEDLIAEGDRVVARVTVEGTQTGPMNMKLLSVPASNRSFKTEHIHVFRIANGKIVEHWAGRDDFGMLRQLGHSFMANGGGK
jgi:steroid delta-isomerase-like uncharacterized protein